MAITQAPFLSLGAKGAVAKTLVASTWKGIKTMRHYVTPANPRSTGQVAQRGILASIVAFWKANAVTEAITTAWNKLALVSGKPQSGFNAFTSSQAKLVGTDTAAEIETAPVSTVAGTIELTRTTDNSIGTNVADTHKFYVGATENKLYERTATISPAPTTLTIVYTPEVGDAFFKVLAADYLLAGYYETSGIYAIPAVTP
jgi:hypothetical protein